MFENVGAIGLAAVLGWGGAAQAQAPNWEKLRQAYAVASGKPVTMKETAKASDKAYILRLVLTGPKGERVPGVYMRPKADGVYPCVLVLHGLGSSKDEMLSFFGQPLVDRGVAVLALDAPHHGERKTAGERQNDPLTFANTIQEGVREYRRALDWLAARKDVDNKRVGLLGYSMGSMMGSILGGVEERVKAFSLCVGGDPILGMAATLPPAFASAAYVVSPSLFIGHIAPRPVLMLNGKQDTTMPKAASDRLYQAAKSPKQQLWYDSGHLLPHEAGEKAVNWIVEKVKA